MISEEEIYEIGQTIWKQICQTDDLNYRRYLLILLKQFMDEAMNFLDRKGK